MNCQNVELRRIRELEFDLALAKKGKESLRAMISHLTRFLDTIVDESADCVFTTRAREAIDDYLEIKEHQKAIRGESI